jgi:hypothetical protein
MIIKIKHKDNKPFTLKYRKGSTWVAGKIGDIITLNNTNYIIRDILEDVIIVETYQPPRTFKVFDFTITYNYRPNTDIYQEILPKDTTITTIVPDNFNSLSFDEQKAILKSLVIEGLEQSVLFDTPDEPEFEISDVDFCFEEVE